MSHIIARVGPSILTLLVWIVLVPNIAPNPVPDSLALLWFAGCLLLAALVGWEIREAIPPKPKPPKRKQTAASAQEIEAWP